MPNGWPGVELVVRPEEALLQLLRSHSFGMEDHMLAVIFGPVAVEDSPFPLIPVEEGRPRERCQDVEIRQLDSIPDEKFQGRFKNRFVVVVEPKDDPGINHDPVVMEHFDLVLKLAYLVESLIRLIEGIFRNGFQAHEHGHTPAIRCEFDHIPVIAKEHGGLASPFNVEGLHGLPQFPAVSPVTVVKIIHKCHDGIFFESGPDPNS